MPIISYALQTVLYSFTINKYKHPKPREGTGRRETRLSRTTRRANEVS